MKQKQDNVQIPNCIFNPQNHTFKLSAKFRKYLKKRFPNKNIEDEISDAEFRIKSYSETTLKEIADKPKSYLKDYLDTTYEPLERLERKLPENLKEQAEIISLDIFNACQFNNNKTLSNDDAKKLYAKFKGQLLNFDDEFRIEDLPPINDNWVDNLLRLKVFCRDICENKYPKEPLPYKPSLVYDMLLESPKHKALTTSQILDKLSEKHDIIISEDTFRKEYIPKLKRYGVKHKPKTGFYL